MAASYEKEMGGNGGSYKRLSASESAMMCSRCRPGVLNAGVFVLEKEEV